MDIKKKVFIMTMIAMLGALAILIVNIMALVDRHSVSDETVLTVTIAGLIVYSLFFFPAAHLKKKHGLVKSKK